MKFLELSQYYLVQLGTKSKDFQKVFIDNGINAVYVKIDEEWKLYEVLFDKELFDFNSVVKYWSQNEISEELKDKGPMVQPRPYNRIISDFFALYFEVPERLDIILANLSDKEYPEEAYAEFYNTFKKYFLDDAQNTSELFMDYNNIPAHLQFLQKCEEYSFIQYWEEKSIFYETAYKLYEYIVERNGKIYCQFNDGDMRSGESRRFISALISKLYSIGGKVLIVYSDNNVDIFEEIICQKGKIEMVSAENCKKFAEMWLPIISHQSAVVYRQISNKNL